MKILVDTNIILDVLLAREPFLEKSKAVFSKVETGEIHGYLCATTITTIDYFLTKALNKEESKKSIQKLLKLFAIAEVNYIVLEMALEIGFSDFEDAVLYQSGVSVGVDGLVTRNVKDFKNAKLPVYLPSDLLKII